MFFRPAIACFVFVVGISLTALFVLSERLSSATTKSAVQHSQDTADLQGEYKSVLDALRRESAKLRMTSLVDSPARAETEMRILVGFGLIFPRCFIVIEKNGEHRASFMTAKMIGTKAAMDEKGDLIPSKIPLAAPTSGWDQFDKFLKTQGVESPLKLSLDQKLEPDPDEELITIETRSGSEYSMVYFSPNTKSADGRRAWQACERIEREFGVQIGCSHESPRN